MQSLEDTLFAAPLSLTIPLLVHSYPRPSDTWTLRLYPEPTPQGPLFFGTDKLIKRSEMST